MILVSKPTLNGENLSCKIADNPVLKLQREVFFIYKSSKSLTTREKYSICREDKCENLVSYIASDWQWKQWESESNVSDYDIV